MKLPNFIQDTHRIFEQPDFGVYDLAQKINQILMYLTEKEKEEEQKKKDWHDLTNK